jgi:hypothetical protein
VQWSSGIVLRPFNKAIDTDFLPVFNFFPENCFFPENDRAKLHLLHQSGSQSVSGQKFHPAHRGPIVINRVPQVKIRVKVGPADLER